MPGNRTVDRFRIGGDGRNRRLVMRRKSLTHIEQVEIETGLGAGMKHPSRARYRRGPLLRIRLLRTDMERYASRPQSESPGMQHEVYRHVFRTTEFATERPSRPSAID